MVYNLGDSIKGNFDDDAVGPFDLHARACQRLSSLHAADDAAHAAAVLRNHFNIVFAIEGLESRESFCDFHVLHHAFFNVPYYYTTTDIYTRLKVGRPAQRSA